jgi:HK97 gp10 family phage protein
MTFTGDKQLQRRLDALSKEARQEALVKAVMAGAEPVRARTAQLAPKGKTGKLRKNIIKVVTKKTDRDVEVGVGWGDEAWYGLFPELGTRQHSAKPFLRPAFDAEVESSIKEIGAELNRGIERAKRA